MSNLIYEENSALCKFITIDRKVYSIINNLQFIETKENGIVRYQAFEGDIDNISSCLDAVNEKIYSLINLKHE